MANDIWSQKMALRGNAFGGIMEVFAQMARQKQLEEQDALMQQSNPLMVDRSYTTGDIPRPETQVTTDLLGKPIMQNVQGNYRNQPFQTQAPVSIGIPRVQESQQIAPQFSFQNFLTQLQSQNPITQQRVNQFAKAPAVAQAFRPQREAFNPYEGEQETDPITGQTTITRLPLDKESDGKLKLPTGFTEITDPSTKAKIWNKTYGGNLTAKDFVSIQERPYFQPVVDRDGNIKVFDSRTGQFAKSESGVIKAAPTEIKQSIASMNDNLNSIKQVRDILNRGDLTGAVKGRTTKIGTRFFDNAEAEKLQTRIGQLRTIVYGLSGKAINESELAWLENTIIPSLQQPSGNFEARLDELESWLKRKKGTLKQQFPNIKDVDDGAPQEKTVTESDIDNMTKEQLEEFLKGK